MLVLPTLRGFLVADSLNSRIRLVSIDLRPVLTLQLAMRTVSAVGGAKATLRFTISEAASIRLAVSVRGHLQRLASGSANKGTATVTFKQKLRPGSYRLQLSAVSPDGRRATAVGTLRVRS
jgi:hypothetical protein